MLFDNDDHKKSNVSRHGAFRQVSREFWHSVGLCRRLQSMTHISSAQAATAAAQAKTKFK
jgi:hypothetical protein